MITINDFNRILNIDGVNVKAKDVISHAPESHLRALVAFLIGKLESEV